MNLTVWITLFCLCALGEPWSSSSHPGHAQTRNTIEGQVFTPERKPLQNARVALLDDGYSQLSVTYTNTIGRYQFTGFGNGNYYVHIDPIGTNFERQSQRIQVQSISLAGGGQTFRVDFVLVMKPSTGEKTGPAPTGTIFAQEVPEAARREYERGVRHIQEKKIDIAVEAFRQALTIFPDYYAALEELGSQYVERRDYQSAEPLLTRAVEINRDGGRAYYFLGVAQYNLKRRDDAIHSLQRAVEINPESPNANMWLGIILSQSTATRAPAIQAFEKVAQVAKDAIPEVYFYLGSLYSKDNQYAKAADALEHFLRLAPTTGDREKVKKIIEQLRQKATGR